MRVKIARREGKKKTRERERERRGIEKNINDGGGHGTPMCVLFAEHQTDDARLTRNAFRRTDARRAFAR